MRRLLTLVTLTAAACGGGGDPVWAFDPISMTPAALAPDDAGIYAVHTWQLYSDGWDRNNDDKHYVCAVLVELVGSPVACDAEPGCEHAWSVEPTLLESDCDVEVLNDPLFLSAQGLAIGGDAPGEVPYPGKTWSGYADYGRGWETHGHTYPEALDQGGQSEAGSWSGTEPLLWVPTLAFPYP